MGGEKQNPRPLRERAKELYYIFGYRCVVNIFMPLSTNSYGYIIPILINPVLQILNFISS